MKTVTFYSYKGGVGRTLALSNIANRLAEFGKKVCIIDFDLEAPGVPYKFRREMNKKDIKKGLVDYLHHYIEGRIPPSEVASFFIPVASRKGKIDLMPAGNVENPSYWSKLSSLNWDKFFYEKNSTGIAYFYDLKAKIKKELNPDFLLIDSRTGISEIAGITTTLLADDVVLLSVNNEESLDGTRQVLQTILQNPNPTLQKPPKIHFVLTRIPQDEKGGIYRSRTLLQKAERKLLVNSTITAFDSTLLIHSEPALQIEESLLIAYDKEDKIGSAIGIDYLRLFEALTVNDLTEEERVEFKRQRRYVKLKNEILTTESVQKKIELLEEGLEGYRDLDEVFLLSSLGHAEFADGDYSKSEKYFRDILKIEGYQKNYSVKANIASIKVEKGKYREALKITTELLETGFYGGREQAVSIANKCLLKTGQIDEAINLLEKYLIFCPNIVWANNNLASMLSGKQKYEKALVYIYKALEVNPNDNYSNATLAEIQSHLGNEAEFYRNINLALSFGLSWATIKEEHFYKKYLKEPRFLDLLHRYNIFPEEEEQS